MDELQVGGGNWPAMKRWWSLPGKENGGYLTGIAEERLCKREAC
jgi:hypothetical protein